MVQSVVQIEVAHIRGRGFRYCHFVVIEDDPASLLAYVADVVPTHGGCAHVTDERNQPIF